MDEVAQEVDPTTRIGKLFKDSSIEFFLNAILLLIGRPMDPMLMKTRTLLMKTRTLIETVKFRPVRAKIAASSRHLMMELHGYLGI